MFFSFNVFVGHDFTKVTIVVVDRTVTALEDASAAEEGVGGLLKQTQYLDYHT